MVQRQQLRSCNIDQISKESKRGKQRLNLNEGIFDLMLDLIWAMISLDFLVFLRIIKLLQPMGRLLVELELLVPQGGDLLGGVPQVGDLLPQVGRLLQGFSQMGLTQGHLQQSCFKKRLHKIQF